MTTNESKILSSSKQFDKWFFFVSFLIGAFGIIVLKNMEFSQFVVTLWPILWMTVYVFFILTKNRFRLREDIAGDNIYYLGFLFTLTSLASALYLFSLGKGGTEVIISNFGIAHRSPPWVRQEIKFPVD